MLYGSSKFGSCASPQLRSIGDVEWLKDEAAAMVATVQGPPAHPCYFAATALERGTLIFADFVTIDGMAIAAEDIREFLSFYTSLPYRAALILHFDGPSLSLEADEARFWGLLTFLQTQSNRRPRTDYESKDWRFVFDDVDLFFNGHSPHYRQRKSRRAALRPFVVVQTLSNLKGVSGDDQTEPKVADRIRSAVDTYDAIHRSPYLNGKESDWRQFWLLDTNEADTRTCPLIS